MHHFTTELSYGQNSVPDFAAKRDEKSSRHHGSGSGCRPLTHNSASQANSRSDFLPDPQFASCFRFGLHARHRLALCCQICLEKAGGASWAVVPFTWAAGHENVLAAALAVAVARRSPALAV